MIRLLHVIDSAADSQTRTAVEDLGRGLGDGFAAEVRRLGRGGDWRGVAAAALALRRRRDFDIVHAWGGAALAAAALGTSCPVVHTPDLIASRRSIRWLRAVMAHRDVQVVCPAQTQHRSLIRAGVPADRCHVIRPGADFARIRRRRSAELRSALGLGDEDYVLLACGESSAAARHEQAVWAASILHVLDQRYRLLLWGRGKNLARVKRFNQRLGTSGMMSIAQERLGREMRFEELLSAADLAISTADEGSATLPICICMAAALPIVSTVSYTAGELLEDRHNALLVRAGAPRLMAQRILQLREDSGLQWRLGDTARNDAYAYFPLTRFLEQYRSLYRQIPTGRVDLAESASPRLQCGA